MTDRYRMYTGCVDVSFWICRNWCIIIAVFILVIMIFHTKSKRFLMCDEFVSIFTSTWALFITKFEFRSPSFTKSGKKCKSTTKYFKNEFVPFFNISGLARTYRTVFSMQVLHVAGRSCCSSSVVSDAQLPHWMVLGVSHDCQ